MKPCCLAAWLDFKKADQMLGKEGQLHSISDHITPYLSQFYGYLVIRFVAQSHIYYCNVTAPEASINRTKMAQGSKKSSRSDFCPCANASCPASRENLNK